MSLTSPIALPRKESQQGTKHMILRSDFECPPFRRNPTNFIPAPRLNLREYKTLKNEMTISTSQSFSDLKKLIFH
jgi:hypothetical protein